MCVCSGTPEEDRRATVKQLEEPGRNIHTPLTMNTHTIGLSSERPLPQLRSQLRQLYVLFIDHYVQRINLI